MHSCLLSLLTFCRPFVDLLLTFIGSWLLALPLRIYVVVWGGGLVLFCRFFNVRST